MGKGLLVVYIYSGARVCVVEWLPLSRAESGRPSSSSGPTAAAGTVLAEPGEGGRGGLSYMYMYMYDELLTLLRVNNFTLCMCDSCIVCVCVWLTGSADMETLMSGKEM